MRRISLAALLLASPLANASEPCTPRSAEEGVHALATSLQAYSQLDAELFARSLAAAEEVVACPDRELTEKERATLWLARGFEAWIARDEETMASAFREAVAAHPGITPGPDLLPPGSLQAEVLEQARSEHAAALMAAKVLEPVPEELQATASTADASPIQSTGQGRASWGLLGVGLASAAVAGARAVASQRAEDSFWRTTDLAEADSAYALNRGMGIAAWSAAGVSAGFVVGAVVAGRW